MNSDNKSVVGADDVKQTAPVEVVVPATPSETQKEWSVQDITDKVTKKRQVKKIGVVVSSDGRKHSLMYEKGIVFFYNKGVIYVTKSKEFIRDVVRKNKTMLLWLWYEGVKKIVYISKNNKEFVVDLEDLFEGHVTSYSPRTKV